MKGRIYKTIPAELVSAAEGGVVVSADGVYDYLLEKNLETINNEKANTSDLAAIAFSGSYSDLSDTPVIPEIPHNVSSFDNDVGYLTQHLPLKTINGKNLVGTGNIEIIGGGNFEPWMQSDWNLTDDSAVNYIKNKPSIPTIPSNISAFNNDVGYLTLHLDISGKADKSTLARVATTGSYNDLANTPITPTITVLSVTGGYLITIIDENNPSGLSFTITNGTNGSNGVNGTDGVDGTNGADGQDGVSPVVTIASITGGHSVTITDAEHLNGQTFNVMDGANGTNGINGTNGLDGITPHIDATTKHWMIGTIDTGVIAEGQNGLDGANGTNGTNGTDGVTPHIDSTTGNWFIGTADTGVHAQGPAGQDGLNGSNGTNGTNGTDGISPAVTIATISGGHSVTITDADHPSGQSFNVMDGTLANQIQADWNQTSDSAADYIKNKPTIPAEVTETTVTNWGFTKNTGNSNFSGSYNDLTDKPTIPSLAGYATETWVGQLGFLTLHLSLTNYILKSLTTGLLKNDGTVDENTYLTLHQSLTNYIQKNQTAGLVKNDGTIDTNTYLTLHQSLTDYALKSELFSGSYDDLSNKPTIPTNVSSLTNDANYITGMVILSYGSSTWNDFISAYNANKVVYCRASSNSNPASGSQTRLAFMAYVNNATSPTEVEFLYYRSVLTHSDNQLGDQVFVYKLVSNGTWTVTTRNTFIKIVAGTNMTSSYSNGALTLNASTPDLTSYATESWVLQLGYLTSHLDISGKTNTTDLSTVATTGSYNDLSDTPSDISEFNNDSEYVSYDKVTLENSSVFLKSAGDGIATINNIKGNTVAWNQKYVNNRENGSSYGGITFYVIDSFSFYYSGTATITQNIAQSMATINGHKYYFGCSNALEGIYFGEENINARSAIKTSSSSVMTVGVLFANGETYSNAVIFKPTFIDLTLIYGEGNEPTTVAQFEADYERWFGKPLTYEPYDEGSLRPVLMSGIKTTGFNQWDEEWEAGALASDGSIDASWSTRRTTSYIPIIPNAQYYQKCPFDAGFGRVVYYNKEKVFIEVDLNIGLTPNAIFTPPTNACYVRITFGGGYGTTYNHDICINISDSAKNGTYEPYEGHIKTLDITTLKGKLNGSGNSVTVFPDGLKKAGSVYDEIKVEGGVVKAIKRVGSVDLGTLTYDVSYSDTSTFRASLSDIKKSRDTVSIANITTPFYTSATPISVNSEDKTIASDETENKVSIRDTSYSSASSFKAAMSGVILYYELATPQEYILDDISTPINYYVDLYGTEELIQQSNGVAATIVTTYNGELGKDLSKILPPSVITGDIATTSDIPSTTGMVTSSTSGLKIEVVASLPASPDSNTIYIVQSA